MNALVAKVEKIEGTVNELSKDQVIFKKVTRIALMSEEPSEVYESGHSDRIYKIILIDETKYATCSRDKSINIFDAQNNQCIKQLQGHTLHVYDMGLVILKGANSKKKRFLILVTRRG